MRTLREGIIAGLNLFSIRADAETAAMLYGITGSHEIPYEGEICFHPGRTEAEFQSFIKPKPQKSFIEFVSKYGQRS